MITSYDIELRPQLGSIDPVLEYSSASSPVTGSLVADKDHRFRVRARDTTSGIVMISPWSDWHLFDKYVEASNITFSEAVETAIASVLVIENQASINITIAGATEGAQAEPWTFLPSGFLNFNTATETETAEPFALGSDLSFNSAHETDSAQPFNMGINIELYPTSAVETSFAGVWNFFDGDVATRPTRWHFQLYIQSIDYLQTVLDIDYNDIHLTGLMSGANYQFRVMGIIGDSTSEWSEWFAFQATRPVDYLDPITTNKAIAVPRVTITDTRINRKHNSLRVRGTANHADVDVGLNFYGIDVTIPKYLLKYNPSENTYTWEVNIGGQALNIAGDELLYTPLVIDTGGTQLTIEGTL